MPCSGYHVIAADERWRDLWKEAEAPCCCQASFPSWCGGLGLRIDHLFALRVEGEQLPMCELARVVRRTPADEMASDHCAVFVQMDFAPKIGERGVATSPICQFTFGHSAPIELPDFSQLKASPSFSEETGSLRQAGNLSEEKPHSALATVQEGPEKPSNDRPPPPTLPPPAIHRPLPPQGVQPPWVSPRTAGTAVSPRMAVSPRTAVSPRMAVPSPRTASPRLPGWPPQIPGQMPPAQMQQMYLNSKSWSKSRVDHGRHVWAAVHGSLWPYPGHEHVVGSWPDEALESLWHGEEEVRRH
eukprot:symbB.v1.2.019534.t1/scaffold1599.1/size109767/4